MKKKAIEFFWNNRVKTHGHTGWSDPSIYIYDQKLRMNLLRQFLDSCALERKTALDFGCGVGDFSKELSRYFEKVVACDISTEALSVARKKNNKCSNVLFLQDPTQTTGTYDLIISITVLQHITSDNELNKILSFFFDSLNDGGIVFILESTACPSENHGYFKLRTEEELLSFFKRSNFDLWEKKVFYHPQKHPTAQFLAYINCFWGKVFRRVHFKKGLDYLASFYSQKDSGVISDDIISPTKLYLFHKKNSFV